ncbi:MAG: hypothetical protein ACOVSW_07590 [Candidatus Kapaibacteriota bacterium]|jgi:hypothetical protein
MPHVHHHTASVLIRSLALIIILLLPTVRIAAVLHIHEGEKASRTHEHSHSPLTAEDNDCPLCDFLAFSHSEAALIQALVLGVMLLSPCILVSQPRFTSFTSSLRLADRAPPAFPAFA